jgi:anti-sigma factor RsiW
VPDAADDRYELPVTVGLLADLQAGLLDDRTAARLRRRVRTDPAVKAQLAALDRVRRNLSALGVDSESAPNVSADVTATICKALRSAPPPTP